MPLTFADGLIRPGDWVFADDDGILVSPVGERAVRGPHSPESFLWYARGRGHVAAVWRPGGCQPCASSPRSSCRPVSGSHSAGALIPSHGASRGIEEVECSVGLALQL